MRFVLPPIYPICPPALSEEALLAWADGLTRAGAGLVQYRRKGGADSQKLRELRALISLVRPRGCAVVVDDRVDLCLLADADGVHLGQEDLPPTEARQLLGDGKVIGFSTHNLGQAEEAWELPVDYIALGPVFPTATKAHPDPLVSQEVQEAVLEGSPFPVVAIGGVTALRAPQLLARGFASVAVVSALEREPEESFRSLLRSIP